MAVERSAIQSIGGGVGTYLFHNPYGGVLCRLVIHSWSGLGAATSAMLDLDGVSINTPAALPTIASGQSFRGMMFTAIGQTNSYGPLITEVEDNARLINIIGSSWIMYQWERDVPDAGADSMRHTYEATIDLLNALRKQCDKGSKCGCPTHRAIDRAMGDARLSDRT